MAQCDQEANNIIIIGYKDNGLLSLINFTIVIPNSHSVFTL